MPIARVVRHSPLYLYVKLYSLSLLVSIFASRPVSARLRGQTLQRQIDRIRGAAHEAFVRQQEYTARIHSQVTQARGGILSDGLTHKPTGSSPLKDPSIGEVDPPTNRQSALLRRHGGHPFPYALKTLALDPDVRFPAVPLRGSLDRMGRVLKRWTRRLKDLSMVKRAVRQERGDVRRFPELDETAYVRCSRSAHDSEKIFVDRRAERIAGNVELLRRLGLTEVANVHPEDIPRIAVGGSGGGYRATFGFLASLHGLHSAQLYDGVFWLAGVSGSCWTIASLFTVAQGRDPSELVQHYKAVAAEAHHPMSRGALDVVARSPKGVYFLLAPLLSKLRDGNVGIGVMDMYATLTTSYQLLSRSPHARPRLSRSMFQFSKVWDRAGLSEGRSPMPILTAVRVMRPTHVEGEEAKQSRATSLVHERENVDKNDDERKYPTTAYQWWEMNPLEVGSSDEGAWVPTWSYGRAFVSGRSVSTAPEISLSLLLGQATSAPAGPLTGYITTLLATLPEGTLMSRLLGRLNSFVRHKRWEKRWGNPIRGADEPNPLYGFGFRSSDRSLSVETSWEGRGRLKLMDSGMSNNLPNHIFTTSSRQADIIVAFDQSSDVQSGAALARLDDFAKQRALYLVRDEQLSDATISDDAQMLPGSLRARFRGQYAQVFQGWKVDDESRGKDPDKQTFSASLELESRRKPQSAADLHLIYCPLLPHDVEPTFDPVKASFSTSYNLVWKPDEIDQLVQTAKASTQEYVVPVLQRVYERVYQDKRKRRESSAAT